MVIVEKQTFLDEKIQNAAPEFPIDKINKIDLAPYVNADLNVMERDAKKMRNGSPFVFTNLMTLQGLDAVIGWIKKYALLETGTEPALHR